MLDQLLRGAGALGGAGIGAAGGAVARDPSTSSSLSDLLAPLDYPRQALYNLGRGVSRGLTGDGNWDDAMGAIPGALGVAAGGALAATGVGAPLSILGGSLVGGALQAGGNASGKQAFKAPTASDLVDAVGGEGTGAANPLLTMGVGMATDPLTYAGLGAGENAAGMVGRAADRGGLGLETLLKGESGAADIGKLGEAATEMAGGPKMALGGAGTGADLAQPAANAPTFFSRLDEAAAKAPKKADSASMMNFLKGKGIKDEELAYRGVPQLLADNPSVTRDQLMQHLSANPIELNPITKGGAVRPEALDELSRASDDFDAVNGALHKLTYGGSPAIDFDLAEHVHNAGLGDTFLSSLQKAASPDFGPESEYFKNHYNVLVQKVGQPTADRVVSQLGPQNFDTIAKSLPPDLQSALQDRLGSGMSPNNAMIDLRDRLSEHLGSVANDARGGGTFGDYTLPGGSDYTERLLQLQNNKLAQPGHEFDQTMNSHWDDPNVLAHYRSKVRTGPDGEKILHLEELQSDWHQQGRGEGYATPDRQAELQSKHDALGQQIDSLDKEYQEARTNHIQLRQKLNDTPPGTPEHDAAKATWQESQNNVNDISRAQSQLMREKGNLADQIADPSSMIPDAPFKDNWHELLLKQAMRDASEQGIGRLAITPGAEQLKRFPGAGAEGMTRFYDKTVPGFLQKYLKQYGGGAVEPLSLPELQGQTLHSIAIPDKAKQAFLSKGQAMMALPFVAGGGIAGLAGSQSES